MLFIFIFSISVSAFLWNFINIPLDEKILDTKFYNYENYINPLNDPIRFIIFLTIPFFFTILYYQSIHKVFFKNLKLIFFFEKNFELEFFIKKKQNSFFYLIIIILIFEFLILDFRNSISNLDFMHEGMSLSASQNAQLTGEYWKSSFIIRGFFADFYPLFLWNTFNLETIGITRFFQLLIVLLNKILIIKILFDISKLTNLSKYQFDLFFLSLSFLVLSLQDYITPIFSLRSFLLLLFVLIFFNFLQNYSKNFNIFLIGLFSSLSSFWFIDIGLYVNFLIFILILYLALKFEIKKFLILLSSIIFGWLIFFLIFPKLEFFEFFNNSILIFSTLSWFHGLEFPQPFISLDARSGKALLMFLISGFLIIRSINFLQEQKILFLLSIIFLFITSMLYFNYGLSRSDSGHIRMASSFIFIPFFSLILVYLFEKFDLKIQKSPKILKMSSYLVFGCILITTLFFDKKYEKKALLNLLSVNQSISELINSKNDSFLDPEYSEFINYYKALTKKENCIFTFTNEVALFYLMKKKSCSKHYFMWSSFPKAIQFKIIKDLQMEQPNYIIYFSEKDIFNNSKKSVKIVNEFILEKYFFHKNFKGWEIYKKK